jgi:WD40 repeat protein/DNA-binding SARP family transcriptional activator
MEYRILGPLEVRTERGTVTLGGAKPRALLAVLLLHANEPVSGDQLAAALWGADAPNGAVRTVQVHVSRLRKALGDAGVVETTPAGYCLRVRPGELDAENFRRLVEDGRLALAAGDSEQAAARLREALTLWRGSPLAELAYEPFAQAEIARLEEQHLAALEARVEADLASGREAELIGELQHLVTAHPTRERLAGQLMLALYRCGRQAEALTAYDDVRRVLVDEIGVVPGRELRRLHEAILHQDPALERTAGAPPLPRELDAAASPSLEGRDAELQWLQDRWSAADDGHGALITLHGERGMGKTRLAAELAGEVHARGATVLHATGAGPPGEVLTALRRARDASRPMLLVVDHPDGSDADALACLDQLASTVAGAPVLVLVLVDENGAGSLGGLAPDGSLVLQPLDVEAVHAIAAQYAPGLVGERVPAQALLQDSAGVPGRVHEVASRWAREEAVRRVPAMAGRASSERRELRRSEAQLADVVALAAGRDRVPRDVETETVICPFKGLASFEDADAEYFFGRERLVAELIARLVGAPLLGIVGPSGSGKSSVLRAGLLPALEAGVLPGSAACRQVVIRPGEHPMRALEAAWPGDDEPVALAVDQFEETFTVCRDEDERTAFIAQLVSATRDRFGRNMVLLAIRADHYGDCAAYPALSRLLADSHVLVGPMRVDELRRAVECPAERVGLHVEPELVEALVDDVDGQPGALPLLSTALLELWQRREGRRLRHAAYEHAGGVRGAVARLAENAFGRLDPPQQALSRQVLLRLADVDDEGGVERRRVPLHELDDEVGEEGARVVRLLADSRLLTVSAGTVEVAHEALLREWPRLRRWIDESREDLRLERSLHAAAHEWERVGRDDGALLRGARLAEAQDWAQRGKLPLTETERRFLTASLDRARHDRTTRRRRLTFAFGTLAVGLVALAIVALVAINQRHDAENERSVSQSRALGLQAQKTVDVDPGLALRLAQWAVDTSPTRDAEAALRQALLADHQTGVMRADSTIAETAAYNDNGSRIVAGGDDGVVRIFDARSGRALGRLDARHGLLLSARYAPGADAIGLGFADGTLLVTDATLGHPRRLLHVKDVSVNSVAFSRTADRLAAGLGDGTVRVLPVDGGGRAVTLRTQQQAVDGVDISADASRVVSAGEDGTVRLWTVADGSGRLLERASLPERSVRFSPDGRSILAVGDDRLVRSFDARTGAARAPQQGGDRELTSVAFSADGSRFAVGGYDGAIRVWSTAGGTPLTILRGQGARVRDVGFGPTSVRVVSAGDDGTVRTWNTGRTVSWNAGPSTVRNIEFSPDGRSIATGSDDGTVRIWDAATGRLRKSLPGPGDYTTGRFSPRADEVVIAHFGSANALVWPLSAATAHVVVQRPKPDGMNVARFDPSGRRIVYADSVGHVAVLDRRNGRQVSLRGAPKDVWDVRVSPDGQHVAGATLRGDVLVWSLDHPARPERVLRGHHSSVNAIAFSHDGRLVSGGSDRTVRVWNPATGDSVVLRGHLDEVTTAIFTNDGARVLSSSSDGTLRLWDAQGGDQLAVLQSGDVPINDVALSRSGQIATMGKDGMVRVFACEVCGDLRQVRALARARAPQPLTPAERRRYLSAAG